MGLFFLKMFLCKGAVMENKLLKAAQVAQMLNIGVSTVYAYANNGTLPSVYLPQVRDSHATKRNKRALRFAIAEVSRFLDNLTRVGSYPTKWR